MDNPGASIINYMRSLNYRIRAQNIVYLEGLDPVSDGLRQNSDIIDLWNDLRLIITDKGEIIHEARATTEPGIYYTDNPLNPKGAARIAFGQYLDAYEFGIHGRSEQDALVQCGDIAVCRDLNKDGVRTGDKIDVGNHKCNQHTTIGFPSTIEYWSAGCLVGRSPSLHAKFMQLCRDSGRKIFDTTVLDGSKLWELKVLS